MTWADYWKTLVETDAFPVAGLALLIVGAIFRWHEPLSEFIERVAPRMMIPTRPEPLEPIGSTRAYAAKLRAAGHEAAARREEERAEDRQRRLRRGGRAMMVAGVVLFILSVWLL